ncbi:MULTISPECIES: DNA-3-methyladenine glycosylase I [Lactobacillus]|uniref:DNA-3-methyladenine glycosylase I n=1 Tax=Lactobacillus xujianguonis TaxID=2495899 RepID=A0A437SWQ4_9LACO|nr:MULTISPECIES: DNA-3-methyladenine glycosylase I [Lactobacillus]RVU71356.1 DNA-3-methyladenine glycosylase I [Lactobacillus xujianguonis]RVU74059.1 DNA-3-methyladenine glycosylase I [Lactobacillus xujianguonis]
MKLKRCNWGNSNADDLYREYHDHEWGKLNLNEQYLFEMLVLESFQSGLSWATILHKRENFRKAFANFEIAKVAQFDDQDFERLMHDEGIVRNKLKIKAAINNAKMILKMEEAGSSFAAFLQAYLPQPIINHPKQMSDIPSQTELSKKISNGLKKKGFKFVGPVTVYSFLQAVGLINDHLDDCSFKY